jgi:hypothetical protein
MPDIDGQNPLPATLRPPPWYGRASSFVRELPRILGVN